MTHPIWELPLDNGAALILTPCPGTRGTSLADSVAQLKAVGVTTVVTAINEHEMQQQGVSELAQRVQEAHMHWFHAPIEDDCAPDAVFASQWAQISPALHRAIEKGEKVVFHCLGGSGRTGLLAAHLLLEKGWPLARIIRQVQALRPGAFTKPVQVDYIERLAKK